ncbi:MAG: hypothetical protein AAGI38_09405 [Bacteroidota bacterium]
MKHTFLFSLLVLCVLFHVQSQDSKAEIIFADAEESPWYSGVLDVVGQDASGLYVLRNTGRPWSRKEATTYQYELSYYDHSLKLVKSMGLDLKTEDKHRALEYVFQSKGKLYILSSFKNRKLKKKFLFVESVDKKAMKLNNDLKKVGEIDYSAKDRMNPGEYLIKISRDSSKLMIYVDAPYQGQKEERFEVYVLDSELNTLWSKQIKLPYSDKSFVIQKFDVDDNGNAHILGKRYKDGFREEVKDVVNFQYHLLSYVSKGKLVKDYPIKLGNILPVCMEFDFRQDQGVTCTGFYAEKGASKGAKISIKGTYFVSIDYTTKKVTKINTEPLGFDFEVVNLARGKGPFSQTSSLTVDDLVIRRDGGVVLIGEENYSTAVTRGDNRTTYFYKVNDLLVVSLSPTGEMEWTTRVPKRQNTTNDGGVKCSYGLAIVEDKIHLIYNDNAKNYLPDQTEVYSYNLLNSHVVTLATIDSKGGLSKQKLFTSGEAGVTMWPSSSKQIRGKEFILFGRDRKEHRMAKIVFP